MKLNEVIEKAVTDPFFAGELQVTALRAARGGAVSSEFRDLMEYFAETPEELAQLTPTLDEPEAARTTTLTTTITTITTITTVVCTTTSTTTTTTATTTCSAIAALGDEG